MSRIPVSRKDRARSEQRRRKASDNNIERLFTSVIPRIGGGSLTAVSVNEIRDGDTYTLPLAASYNVNKLIAIDLPERYKSFTPTINRTGSDTVTDSNGTDTSIAYDGASWGLLYLTSDGINNWSI